MLIMFMLMAFGSMIAHIIISKRRKFNFFFIILALHQWCYFKSDDRLKTFGEFRAKFAYRIAKMMDKVIPGKHDIPTLVVKLAMKKHWSDVIFCFTCCRRNVEQDTTENLNSPPLAEKGRKTATQDTRANIAGNNYNQAMQNTGDEEKREYKEAWIFYGKMFSHFSGIIFIILIVIALLVVYIGLTSTANAARNALF